MAAPLTPPSSMADLDRQHQQELHQQHLRLVSSPSPMRTSEPIPGLAQSALPAVSSPTTDKHPKGKRKRTATKDKMILEEAYSVNPKPDKQARLEIVNRVSLNEKEVQIWFQNRRQNDRRKSRPLSPQELAALRFSGMHNITSDPITSRSIVVELDPSAFYLSDHSQTHDHSPTSPPHLPPSPIHAHPHHGAGEAIHATPVPRYASQPFSASNQPHVTPHRQMFPPSQEDANHLSHSFSSSVGYLANRWNLGNTYATPLSRDNSYKFDPFYPSSCSSNTSGANRSHMRLSLSLEGKAELVPNNESSPIRETPSRPSSTLPSLSLRRGLQRSHSALPAVTLPPISTLTNSLPPHLVRGRSRDVHAWELCADSETRDELTAQAEHESNGSAIAAISLLRSTSSILQPNTVKRNTSQTKFARPRQIKKPRFNRTTSSVARLETCWASDEKSRESCHAKMNVSMLVSPSDSDKENWSPRRDGSSAEGRRQMPPGSPIRSQSARRIGRVLQGRKSPAFLMRSNTVPSEARSPVKTGIHTLADLEPKAESPRNDEVSRFMCGEVSPSKKGDMDCVAGLLSLSQGAWR
ncbi:hypothetical protein ACHAO4_009054 [Trichoderma viride]